MIQLYIHICMRVLSCFSRVQLFMNPWTAACQAPLSMEFSRQGYWSGLPCSPPGDLPNPGIKPASLTSPVLAGRFFTTLTTWEALFLVIPYAKVFERYIGVSETLAHNFPTVWTTLKRSTQVILPRLFASWFLNRWQGGGVEACLWGSFSYWSWALSRLEPRGKRNGLGRRLEF